MRYAPGGIAVVVLVCVVACNGEQQRATVNIDAEIVQLKKQIVAAPKSPSPHLQLSALLAAKGDWDRAEKEINIAMQLDPHDPLLNINAAQMYRQRGMMAKELQMLNLAVGIDPENPLSHYVLGLTYERQSEPSKAMTEFRETKRLIDMLSSPGRPIEVPNRIIHGTRDETYYHDRFGHEYILDWILSPLAKKLSR